MHSEGKGDKEVHLAGADKGSYGGICSYCKKKAGQKCMDCPECKGKSSGSSLESAKKCNSCGKSGHMDSDCWNKNPNKAPQWFKDLSNKKEAAGSNVEVMLANIE